MDESRNAVVLNSGASKTVCRKFWFNISQGSLGYKEKHHIVFTKSDNQYEFSDCALVTAISGAIIPITIGTTQTKMHVDIVPSNILLLLSKESMKWANVKLNFENDTITAFRQPINLIVTKSGHYTISITNIKHVLKNLNTTDQHITLTLANNKLDKDMAMKLHRQFALVCANKLIKLINSGGQEWRNNQKRESWNLKSNKWMQYLPNL